MVTGGLAAPRDAHWGPDVVSGRLAALDCGMGLLLAAGFAKLHEKCLSGLGTWRRLNGSCRHYCGHLVLVTAVLAGTASSARTLLDRDHG